MSTSPMPTSPTIIINKAILYGARDLRMEQESLSLDSLQPKQLYVQTEVSALSTGTDLGNYEGRSREVPTAPDYPRWVGYNNIGVVKAVGPEVTKFQVGQRVFAPSPHQSGYVAHEDDLLVPVPDGVSPETASLCYLTNLGVAGLRQLNYEAGERVTVIGLGVIGLCTVAVANAMGARVTAIANAELRRQLALKMGADQAFLPGEAKQSGVEADIVVNTANTWSAYRESVDIARFGGRISFLGFPGRAQPAPDFNPLAMEWFYGKQLILAGAGFSPRCEVPPQDVKFTVRRNVEMILDFARRGKLPVDQLITHRFPWQNLRDAYELALTHSKDLAAAIFDWR
ncbi:MAG: zinc-binding dehydrogenase [Bryobacterales bacterium]|nr:zinc-binding dehydrogenase [Bryobacterales bacterium]